jgi:ADP-heptose:LPS heptosyltransferase
LRPIKRQALVKRKGMQVVKALAGQDEVTQAPHQVVRNLRLLDSRVPDLPVEGATPMTFWPVLQLQGPEKKRVSDEVRALAGPGPLIGLIPGARHGSKRWPVAHLAAVGDDCIRRGYGVMALGGLGDTERVKALCETMTTRPLAETSKGSLRRLACLLAACDVVVSPDSGPAHMAAAMGVGTVAVFGPTSPARWRPVGPNVQVVRSNVDCSPCANYGTSACPEKHHACMNDLHPEAVMNAVVRCLAERSGKG